MMDRLYVIRILQEDTTKKRMREFMEKLYVIRILQGNTTLGHNPSDETSCMWYEYYKEIQQLTIKNEQFKGCMWHEYYKEIQRNRNGVIDQLVVCDMYITVKYNITPFISI